MSWLSPESEAHLRKLAAGAQADPGFQCGEPHRLHRIVVQMIVLRKENPVFAGNDLQVIDTGREQVLGYARRLDGMRVPPFAKFSATARVTSKCHLRLYGLNNELEKLLTHMPVPYDDLARQPFKLAVIQC